MSNWEEIVKQKLEGCEVTPPEGSLDEFREKLEASREKRAKKSAGPLWIIAPALAACLAIFLLIGRHQKADEISVIDTPSEIVSELTENQFSTEDLQFVDHHTSIIDTAAVGTAVRTAEITLTENPTVAVAEEVSVAQETLAIDMHSETATNDHAETYSGAVEIVTEDNDKVETASGKSKERKKKQNSKKKENGKLFGTICGVSGGAITASVLSTTGLATYSAAEAAVSIPVIAIPLFAAAPTPAEVVPFDELLNTKYYLPFKAGVSARIPLAKRFYLTTGVDYVLYRYDLTYSVSGVKTKLINYLEIPVRVDWNFVERRWVDAYLGLGFSADFCVGATLDGYKTDMKVFNSTLLGVAGVQFNILPDLGIFVEPQFTYSIIAREEKPQYFALGTGIRYTLGRRAKKNNHQ